MKNLLQLFLLIILASLISSCDLIGLGKEETDPEKTLGKVGNFWDISATGYPDAEITIDSNKDGDVVASFPFDGRTVRVEGKITEKAIYDYVYSNGDKKKPYTLVRFDAKVGDKWEYKVGNQKVVREVVHRSTDNDTFYGFMLIKTIDVEETIPAGVMINGEVSQVSKILWRFNHKFGFISADVTDTSNKTTRVSSGYTNAAD
jgi:hypothetical protein